MDFFYLLNKNLKEASSYKLVRRSEWLLVFSNGSALGWLFFLGGITISSLLLYSGLLTKTFFQKELAAGIFICCTSAFFTVFGFIAGVGTSKLIFDLSSKTFSKTDLSLKSFIRITGIFSDLSGISLDVKILRIKGREYPVYIAKLLSGKFKEDLIIGVSHSKAKVHNLLEMLSRQLGVSVVPGNK
jgi:hypothetical protein